MSERDADFETVWGYINGAEAHSASCAIAEANGRHGCSCRIGDAFAGVLAERARYKSEAEGRRAWTAKTMPVVKEHNRWAKTQRFRLRRQVRRVKEATHARITELEAERDAALARAEELQGREDRMKRILGRATPLHTYKGATHSSSCFACEVLADLYGLGPKASSASITTGTGGTRRALSPTGEVRGEAE